MSGQRYPDWQLHQHLNSDHFRAVDALRRFQNGACWMCSMDPETTNPTRSVVVDHCHTTGLIRGLLCRGCNTEEALDLRDPSPRWRWYREFPPAARLGLRALYIDQFRHRPVYDTPRSTADLAVSARVCADAMERLFAGAVAS